MTTAQVVETSVTVNDNSPIQDYVNPDDQTQPTFEMTPGFKPFTIIIIIIITIFWFIILTKKGFNHSSISSFHHDAFALLCNGIQGTVHRGTCLDSNC